MASRRRTLAAAVAVALAVGIQPGAQASDEELDATAGVFWRFPLQKDLQIDRSKEPEFGFNIGSQNIEKYRNQVTFHSALRPRERGSWEALSLQFDDSGLPAISLSGRDELERFSRGLEVGGAFGTTLGGEVAETQAATNFGGARRAPRRLILDLGAAAQGSAGATQGNGIIFDSSSRSAGR